MSKGTVRFPESAIAGGRIGTAAVVEEGIYQRMLDYAIRQPGVLGDDLRCAAALDTKPETAVIPRGVKTEKQDPLARTQALGRLGTGAMNKTERAYSELLSARLHMGEILWFRFEAYKLRLGDNTFYTPDFAVISADRNTEFHEVKGHWTDKARAKTKVAAAQFPNRFIAIQRDGRHGWRYEDLTSRSW